MFLCFLKIDWAWQGLTLCFFDKTIKSHEIPGPWFNIKITSYLYRISHCGDKTILRPSYLHNGIPYTGEMTSLYWIKALASLLPTLFGAWPMRGLHHADGQFCNTVWSPCKATNFMKNPHNRHPIGHIWGWGIGSLWVQTVIMFSLNRCSTVHNIMLCWTTLYNGTQLCIDACLLCTVMISNENNW